MGGWRLVRRGFSPGNPVSSPSFFFDVPSGVNCRKPLQLFELDVFCDPFFASQLSAFFQGVLRRGFFPGGPPFLGCAFLSPSFILRFPETGSPAWTFQDFPLWVVHAGASPQGSPPSAASCRFLVAGFCYAPFPSEAPLFFKLFLTGFVMVCLT